MASSKCSVDSCKRDFDILCGHCKSNVCSKHYIEHVKLANEDLTPLADRLNSILNDVQQDIPLQGVFQELEHWRSTAHEEIDKICDQRKQQLQEIIEAKLAKQTTKLQEIRQELKELIDEGDASFKQIEKVKTAIDECQKQYSDIKADRFLKIELKPIEMMIQIIDEQYFNGGTLLSKEHQIKLNEFYGKCDQKWVLIYKATRDGSQGTDFHRCCDNQGPTMTIIQSKSGGYLFGGYTSVSWGAVGNYVVDNNGPFIFTLTNPHDIPPTKYQNSRPEYAIHAANNYGPTFGGGHDIYVCNQSHINTGSTTNFPHSYIDTTGKNYTTFAGNKNFQTSEIEVYRLETN